MSARPRALAVVFPGCAYLEIAHAVAGLRAHADVAFVSPRGGSVETLDGPCVAATRAFADEPFPPRVGSQAPVRAVVVPGGELDAVKDDDALSDLLRRASGAGAVVAGICNGALLLARAGLLRGRRATHTAVDRYAPRAAWAPLRDLADPWLEGSTYVDRPVVVDGPIVTAKPWAAIEFAAALLVAAELSTPTEAARSASYARGERLGPEAALVHFAVTLREGPAAMSRALVEAHVAFLRELERDGALVLAGPFAGAPEGLVVIRATDLAAAEALAARDPFVVAGARVASVRAWEISSEANAHMGVARGPLAP